MIRDVRGWERMIDFRTDTVIRLTEAAVLLQVKYGTVHRWARYGVSGRKLESAFLGGTAYTSLEALNRFSGQESQSPAPQPPAKDHEDAMRELARRGAISGGQPGWQSRKSRHRQSA
jgi:hypothetical protein